MNEYGKFSKSGSSVAISLEPEFKGISSLLSDITNYRIITEKDGFAAIKISRALFQAFLKYRLTESKAGDLTTDEEATLKRVLSYLIEVEEGRIPQLNVPDKVKKVSKQIQTDDIQIKDVPIGSTHAPVSKSRTSSYNNGLMKPNSAAGINLEAPTDGYFSNHIQAVEGRRHDAHRSRSPSPKSSLHFPSREGKRSRSPSWRFYEERNEQSLYGKSSRKDDQFMNVVTNEKSDFANMSSMHASSSRSEYDHYSDNREASRGAVGGGSGGRHSGRKKDEIQSVRVIDGCLVNRILRIRFDDNTNSSMYMTNSNNPAASSQQQFHYEMMSSKNMQAATSTGSPTSTENSRRSPKRVPNVVNSDSFSPNAANESSFSMKVKTAPTLSQAKNVALTKLGLYTDLAKSAYRK